MDTNNEGTWLEDDSEVDQEIYISEYDITSTPNDFNIITIGSYIESGAIVLPTFQRHFVWDKARASKFIESLILGLPVPQIFLYEESRNKFLILDGQQRLMSIYYFMKGRFPNPSKRAFLRDVFLENNKIPDEILFNKEHFQSFSLNLPKRDTKTNSPFEGLNYHTLGEYKASFDLRPIRNIIVKQNEPKEDNSSIYEIYDRLNTGGQNLKPQEIRSNLYFSGFYKMIHTLNRNQQWRDVIGKQDEDINLKDVELILRSFAMLIWGDKYRPSMARFLNVFSNHAKKNYDDVKVKRLKEIFEMFLASVSVLPTGSFFSQHTGRFSIALFEAAFVGRCEKLARQEAGGTIAPLQKEELNAFKEHLDFIRQQQEGTTKQKNVSARLTLARQLFQPS